MTPNDARLLVERSRHLGGGDDPSERLIAGGYAFGEEDQIWIEVESIGREPITHSPESGDHFVGDE